MFFGTRVVGLVAVVLSATACFAPTTPSSDGEESRQGVAEPTSQSQAFSYWGDESPTPLDHPIPSFKIPTGVAPPAPPDLDLFNEPYDKLLLSKGCYLKTVSLYDPSRGKKIEILVTVCE